MHGSRCAVRVPTEKEGARQCVLRTVVAPYLLQWAGVGRLPYSLKGCSKSTFHPFTTQPYVDGGSGDIF